jgi:hypothetical protein
MKSKIIFLLTLFVGICAIRVLLMLAGAHISVPYLDPFIHMVQDFLVDIGRKAAGKVFGFGR